MLKRKASDKNETELSNEKEEIIPKFLRANFWHEEGMMFYYVTFRLPDKIKPDFKFHPSITCLGEIYGLNIEPKYARENQDVKSVEDPTHPLSWINDKWIGIFGASDNQWKVSTSAEKMFYANVDHLKSDDDEITFEGRFCQIMTELCGNPVKDANGIIYGIVVPCFN